MRMYVLNMKETRWWRYVEAVAEGASGVEIARKVQFDQSAVSRWKKGERPGWEFVLKFARAYNRNVLEALVEAEFITEDEAKLREVKVGVRDLTDVALAEELLRRAKG